MINMPFRKTFRYFFNEVFYLEKLGNNSQNLANKNIIKLNIVRIKIYYKKREELE